MSSTGGTVFFWKSPFHKLKKYFIYILKDEDIINLGAVIMSFHFGRNKLISWIYTTENSNCDYIAEVINFVVHFYYFSNDLDHDN